VRGTLIEPASPIVRRLALELDVDLATLTGGGPGARILKADVLAAARAAAVPSTRDLTIAIDVDLWAARELCARIADAAGGEHGPPPTIADMVVKACALAAQASAVDVRVTLDGRTLPAVPRAADESLGRIARETRAAAPSRGWAAPSPGRPAPSLGGPASGSAALLSVDTATRSATVTLRCDSRVLPTAAAAAMLTAVGEWLERPAALL